MTNLKLRYVSVAALIRYKDNRRFILCERSETDEFKPKNTVFPSGRLERTESIEQRLREEISSEVPGLQIINSDPVYIGDAQFMRDGYPVTQLCFGLSTYQFRLPKSSDELKRIFWITPSEFYKKYEANDYLAQVHRLVKKAQDINFLR